MKLRTIQLFYIFFSLALSPILAMETYAQASPEASMDSETNMEMGMVGMKGHHHQETSLPMSCEQACQFLNQNCQMDHNCHYNMTTLLPSGFEINKNPLKLATHISPRSGNQFRPKSNPRPPRFF